VQRNRSTRGEKYTGNFSECRHGMFGQINRLERILRREPSAESFAAHSPQRLRTATFATRFRDRGKMLVPHTPTEGSVSCNTFQRSESGIQFFLVKHQEG